LNARHVALKANWQHVTARNFAVGVLAIAREQELQPKLEPW